MHAPNHEWATRADSASPHENAAETSSAPQLSPHAMTCSPFRRAAQMRSSPAPTQTACSAPPCFSRRMVVTYSPYARASGSMIASGVSVEPT